ATSQVCNEGFPISKLNKVKVKQLSGLFCVMKGGWKGVCGGWEKILAVSWFLIGFSTVQGCDPVLLRQPEALVVIKLSLIQVRSRCKITSTCEDDVKNDSGNDLGDDFNYEPNSHDDVEDDDGDSLDVTRKSEHDCDVKRIADLMVEGIWNLEFRTEDEACQFYNDYACWHGFVMRKDDIVRDKEGKIICRQLVCNKEGRRNMRYLDLENRSREARSIMRTKCPARLKVKVDYGCGRRKGLIYDNNDYRDFDQRWKAILKKYNLIGNTWMEKTYETRAIWSYYFLQEKLFGYIRMMSQYEGINSLIRFYVYHKNTLIDFMHNLDWALKEYRNNELVADFKSQCFEPVMITSLEVYERFASSCFTCNIFKKIRNGIQRAGALNIKILSTVLDKVEFSVTTLGDPVKDRRVELDRCNNLFSCSCRLFESHGIPCSYIFCAMKYENLLDFPESLIYKRWTKNAKNDFSSTTMHVNEDVGRSCKHGMSPPNTNVEDVDDPFVKTDHGNPCEATNDNASSKIDSSQQRSVKSSKSSTVKFEELSRTKTKVFKKGGSRKFMAKDLRNGKGKDNKFDEVWNLHKRGEGLTPTGWTCLCKLLMHQSYDRSQKWLNTPVCKEERVPLSTEVSQMQDIGLIVAHNKIIKR
ncbi:hypothetical protein HN873_039829, partial [Arachis hypogaea]